MDQSETTLAILAHVLGLFTGFLGPLILYLVKRDGSFSAKHALHATWWQALFAAVAVVGMIAVFALVFAMEPGPRGSGSPAMLAPMALFYCVFFVMWIADLVFTITNAIRASRGQPPSYAGVSNMLG